MGKNLCIGCSKRLWKKRELLHRNCRACQRKVEAALYNVYGWEPDFSKKFKDENGIVFMCGKKPLQNVYKILDYNPKAKLPIRDLSQYRNYTWSEERIV